MKAQASALVRSVLEGSDRGNVPMLVYADGALSPPEQRPRLLAQVVNHRKVRVTVTQGPDAGLSRELVSDTLRVGSSSDNDLALTDSSVSQHHCAIEPTASGVRVRDERSTSGVFIGALRVFDALVNGPVQLRIGASVLAIEPLDETVVREQLVQERFQGLVGKSTRMRELFAELARVAPTDMPVLIEGEAGSGKQAVAEALHAESGHSKAPFVVFDCSAAAPSLADGELFGQEFTGAGASRPGVFEQADGGTLLLDELGELPKDLQPKLLRVLERREVRRLGSERALPFDVRLVSTTSRNLDAEVKRGGFDPALYLRLATAGMQLPPLRDRMEDLPLLVAHFVERSRPARSLEEIPKALWALLEGHHWPGNVRELSNAVQRFVGTACRVLPVEWSRDADARGPSGDGALLEPLVPLRAARREATEAFERAYLANVLQRTRGNVTRAAALAEVSRQMMQKLMRKHGAD